MRYSSSSPVGTLARCAGVLAALAVATPAIAQSQSAKRILTQDTYDSWNRIDNPVLSNDGQWAAYTLTPISGDGTLIVRSTSSSTEYRVPRGYTGRLTTTIAKGGGFRAPPATITADSRYVLVTVFPAKAVFDSAKRDKKRKTPKASVTLLTLATGAVTTIPDVTGCKPAKNVGRYLFCTMEKDTTPAAKPAGKPAATDSAERGKSKKSFGTTLLVRDLTTGTDMRIAEVESHVVDDDATQIAYVVASADSTKDGVYLYTLATGRTTPILTGPGTYKGLAFDKKTTQLVFVSDRAERSEKKPRFAIYHTKINTKTVLKLAPPTAVMSAAAFGADSVLSGTVRFTDAGNALLFRIGPAALDSIPQDSLADKPMYDLWNWKDPRLQTEQKETAAADRDRSIAAIYHLAERKLVRLGTESAPTVQVTADGRYGLAVDEGPYMIAAMWGDGGNDLYAVDTKTGQRTVIAQHLPMRGLLSPSGRYVSYFKDGDWYTYAFATGKIVNVTAKAPGVAFDQRDTFDQPDIPPPWGVAGWTKSDARMIINDRYDLWSFDPTGATAPIMVTDSVGRRERIVFRIVNVADDDRADADADSARGLDPMQPLLLSAVNWDTKASGFYRDQLGVTKAPERVAMADQRFGTPAKAKNAAMYLVTRESVREFPDLWIGNRLDALTKISDANPQQSQYLWPTAELVQWMSDDRVPLKGILYKPENFDPSKQYPMVVYYYEMLSDRLHMYHVPAGRNVVNPSVYTSRGYLVFFPDIAYTTGYPGASAVKSIVPGVRMLIDRGYVKPDAIGCAGQSWGGYQTAYMVTQTNLFRACFAGAPVANMTSAYGGIRWGSGKSRQFQYEHEQSRIGGSLWTYRDRFIENSPLFYLDKVHTPLFIMSNDNDEAVPWTQGIELFTALRRLEKEAYLVNYNGDFHNPVKDANKKDVDRKMLQFFDHFLKGASAPAWMTKGVPYVTRNRYLMEPPEPAPQPTEQ